MLDWSWIASNWVYHSVAESVPLLDDAVGEILGQVMIKEMGVDLANIHGIGHSLGAHNAGHIGRKIAEVGEKGKIARVTGIVYTANITGKTLVLNKNLPSIM